MAREEKVLRQMYLGFKERETRQYEVTRGIALLSPGYAFQGALEAVLGIGLVRHNAFRAACRDYIEVVRDFIRVRDAADPHSPHILFVGGYVSQRPLDPLDIPRFPGVSLSAVEGLRESWVPLGLLLAEALAAFLFALWAVNRAPVVQAG